MNFIERSSDNFFQSADFLQAREKDEPPRTLIYADGRTTRCARKRYKRVCPHTFPHIHEISLSKFSFKRKKKKEEKPSNANADAGAIRFTDVHKYT